ncbi:MAG: hypothetical protein JSV86_00075 [Gemmatimonadota bacterium]|nr:MAG: hypothetical protein JSV86_00075 [Gemmatimonadota bacterium]
MTALLAMFTTVLAVGYAVWPLLRCRSTQPLAAEPGNGVGEAGPEVAALLAWAAAAGEIRRSRAGREALGS